jgi:hypothetical protein
VQVTAVAIPPGPRHRGLAPLRRKKPAATGGTPGSPRRSQGEGQRLPATRSYVSRVMPAALNSAFCTRCEGVFGNFSTKRR